MFDNNIPVSLLKGLANKNNTHLSRLLDLYDSSIFTFKKEKNEKKINEEYNSWIKRRDDGNKRTALEKELEKRESYEKDVIQRRKAYEIYCNKMQPVWDTKLQEVISARQNMLDKILSWKLQDKCLLRYIFAEKTVTNRFLKIEISFSIKKKIYKDINILVYMLS